MKYQVLQGDCIKVLRSLKDQSVDSVVTDPPYALGFMGRNWDTFGSVPACQEKQDHYDFPLKTRSRSIAEMSRSNKPFQEWCELWAAECLRVLKPGGYLLAFGGTRTYHRMACGIEDAGFEIRDSLHWIHGSGFPKSMDVSKAIDKAAGAEREYVGEGRYASRKPRPYEGGSALHISEYDPRQGHPVTAAATEDAARWEGWGTALKPAHEPIVVARKPLIGTVAANVLQYGIGGLNIDGCRVGAEARVNEPAGNKPGGASYMMSVTGMPQDAEARTAEGRWPPNILLSEEAAEEMDRQTGTLTSGSNNFIRESSADFSGNTSPAYGAESRPAGQQMISYGDTGGASRFFPCFKYQAKASPSERPKVNGIAHPTCKPVALMRWLVKLVTPPEGIVLDPFAGTGTTAEACLDEGFKCILIERDEDYLRLIRARMNKRPLSLFD
jgi:DNA modification methylase